MFLPVSNNVIREYDQNSFQASAMVALVGVQATEDEEFIASVDATRVGLRTSAFGGSTQNLVLTFELGILNGTIHSVAYTVNVVIAGSFSDNKDVSGSAQP